MIGEWIAENALGIIGTIFGLSGPLALFLAWVLRKWLAQSFELRKPRLTDAEKAEEMERLARSVLSTPVIREFAESTVTSEYRQERFYEAVSGVVKRDKSTQEFIDGRAKHVFASHESAMRILISDAVRGVGADLQKSMTDSQSMFMTELRGIRETLTEKVDAFREEVAEMRTELAVHKASDEAKKPR